MNADVLRDRDAQREMAAALGRPLEDLYKARYYLEREIARRESEERMAREARS